MPNVSATEAPHASSISRRTAPRPAPGSPAVTRWRSPRVVRLDAGLARAGREVGGEAEGSEDRGDAQRLDEVEEPAGLAHPDRHDGGARGLERGVVRDAARVQGVVE